MILYSDKTYLKNNVPKQESWVDGKKNFQINFQGFHLHHFASISPRASVNELTPNVGCRFSSLVRLHSHTNSKHFLDLYVKENDPFMEAGVIA